MLKKILKVLGIILAVLIVALGVLYFILKDRVGLALAVYGEDKEAIIYYVKEKGVDPNNVYSRLNLTSYYIFSHKDNLDYDFLKLLVDLGFELNQGGTEKITPLFHAIVWNNPKLIKFLIDNGADVNILLNGKLSPLGFSLRMGDCESAKILSDYGASLEKDFQKNDLFFKLKECEKNNWISQQKTNKNMQYLFK